ncbi:hypothetical protein KY285_026177 [Solanum tuberosum]|nr:hypothetical protein KY285_026177 [Solanum tuberosum]
MENRLKDMQRKNEELKNEKAEVEAKLKMYLEKFKEWESRVSLQEEEAAKNHVADVSMIQKMVEDLEAEDNDFVEMNGKASGADGDLQEKQLSPPRAPLVHSTANGNGNASDLNLTPKYSCGTGNAVDTDMVIVCSGCGNGNTDFISTKTNLLNCPDVQTLHPMPSAGGSAQVNTNVSNIEKKRRHLEEADTTIWFTIFPTNMECQIKAVMYADEIEQYADKLKLLNTYLISTARVKVSLTSYGKPIHKFYWILDKETIIEEIKPSNEVENPLPPPTKLNITSFDRIPHLMVDSAAEIDILTIVLRCGPQKNVSRSHHRCREITLLTIILTLLSLCSHTLRKNQFLFTLWEDFREIEGHEIASKMATEADLLVILGRSIGISTYQGLSLQTRYNSTVRVNQNYPQAAALINWAKENKTMLLSCASEKTSTSSSVAPTIVTPAGQQLISIAKISSAPSMGVFYVEAEMAILDEFQDFCVLECLGCKQKKRTKDRKDFECPKCNRKTSLVPRCSFQIDLINGTATTTTSISAELGEKLLSMTAEDIFDITCTKSTTDRTSKKIKPLEISEVEVMATTTAGGSSNATPKFEPPTPTKKV